MQSCVPLLSLGCAPTEAEAVAAEAEVEAEAARAEAARAAVEDANAEAERTAAAEPEDAAAAVERAAERATAAAAAAVTRAAERAAGRVAERAAVDAALPGLCVRVVAALCQQLNEKIDRIREAAGVALRELLSTAGVAQHVPHLAELRALFKVDAAEVATHVSHAGDRGEGVARLAQGIAADVREID